MRRLQADAPVIHTGQRGCRSGRGWAICDGSELQANRNDALLAAIRVRFAGDGGDDPTARFALPDLRGRVVAGADPRRSQPNGATSGSRGAAEIPYAVARWGISVYGEFPFKD
jgi:microcystin-dependent protein